MSRRVRIPVLCLLALGLVVGVVRADNPPSLTAGTASAALGGLPEDAREAWVPFAVDLPELLGRATPLVPMLDGAFGASLLFLHEPGDAVVPAVTRDGLPLGVGHLWADDPWTVALAGAVPARFGLGLDRWGGTAPALDLADAAYPEDGAVTDTYFTKGTDDAYLRRVSFRTPRAPWALRLDFDEHIDQYPEDESSHPLHESRRRSLRAALQRQLPTGDVVGLAYEKIRKHKSDLPLSADYEHQEIWIQRAAADWRGETALGTARLVVYSQSNDLEWKESSRDEAARKIETTREGARLELALPTDLRLALRAAAWRLRDDGFGTDDWAAGAVADGNRDGAASLGRPLHAAGLDGTVLAALRWDGEAGWSPAARVDLGAGVDRGWRLSLEHGGRAPRLDERLTALRLSGSGHTATMLPGRDLDWERLDRLTLALYAPLLGAEVELRGAARRQRDAIGWTALSGETTVGRWTNDVDLDAWTADLILRRALRVAGLMRVEAILSRRSWTRHEGTPVGLPPESSAVLNVFWERHMFREDGILEIGWVLEHRGEMDDPWLPVGDVRLPATTVQHLLIGFRLVGVDLGLELRNLGNNRDQVSAAAYRLGQTNRWRMQWTFRR